MTEQEIFDTAGGRILKQGGPSLSVIAQTCSYRGKGDRVCAAGALIQDEEYLSEMEGLRWCDLIKEWPERFSRFEGQTDFIMQLQQAHDQSVRGDDAVFLSLFRKRARALAESRGLSTAVLEGAE